MDETTTPEQTEPGDTETVDAAVDEVAPVSDTARFHAFMVLEGVETGDNRIFTNGSLSWRDLPLPLMATDESDHGATVVNATHLIGNFDRIERRGNEIHGWGSYIANPDDEAARLIALIEAGELRGISIDADAVEAEMLLPGEWFDDGDQSEQATDEDGLPGETETDENGDDWVVVSEKDPKLRITEGRVMGATVVVFPAFQEAFIEPDGPTDSGMVDEGLTASAPALMFSHGVTGFMVAAANADESGPTDEWVVPVEPPTAWFTVDEADGPTAFTYSDDGQIMGHLAAAGSCHVGVAGECVTPPTSPSNYARFHTGEIITAEGDRVAVGHLTFNTGHAGLKLRANDTRAHYDNTGTVFADVVAVDGEHGIWVCGAVRPGFTLADRRAIMSAPPSGDWRSFGGQLDLVAALAVNVPGFNVARFRKDDTGMVASLVAGGHVPVSDKIEGMDGEQVDRLIDLVAASIGRSHEQRLAAATRTVKGEQDV